MNCYSSLVALCLCITFIVGGLGASFPSKWQRCKVTDTECIGRAATEAVFDLRKGNRNLRILPLDPMSMNRLNIPSNGGSVEISQEMTNIKIHGLTYGEITKVNIVNITKDGLEMAMDTMTYKINIIGDYSLKGRILLLPVVGNGKCNITMEKLSTKHYMVGTPVKRDGKNYIHIDKYVVDFTPESIHYNFENLLNGDKALGENMNKVLNDNSMLVFNEVKNGYQETFSLAFQSFSNSIFEHVPIDEIFIF